MDHRYMHIYIDLSFYYVSVLYIFRTEATELAIRLARAHTKSKDMIVLDQ